MGHQSTRKVLIYFTVQCICILGGGTSFQILAAAVAATHYPEVEKQPRAVVLFVGLAFCCYITLLFGVVMVASVAYASLEEPLLALIQQASISAKTRLYHGGIGNVAAKSIGTSEAEGGLEVARRSGTNREALTLTLFSSYTSSYAAFKLYSIQCESPFFIGSSIFILTILGPIIAINYEWAKECGEVATKTYQAQTTAAGPALGIAKTKGFA
ncbi:unnamed protein product [Tilletia caries]|nr:unnamed protein product [Tilletia caries]